MLFGTHLVAAAAFGEWSRRPLPAVVLGAAFPDLVDKPLATLGVVDVFHSVGHSAFFLLAVAPLAYAVPSVRAFAIGWGSHLVLDAFHVVINGRAHDALFLGWPLTSPPTPLRIPPGEFFFYYLWSPSFFVEIGIWILAIVVLQSRIQDTVAWLRQSRE